MRKKIMILVLTMVLTLSSTAFAHAAQPGGGGAGSVNGTESTNGAGSTDRANGTDGALPAGSGENVQTGEPTAAPAPAENENEQTEDENAQDAQQNTETSDDAKADVKKETKTKQVSKYQKGLAAYIRSKNPKLSKSWSTKLAGYFIKSGKKKQDRPEGLDGAGAARKQFPRQGKQQIRL